MTLGTLGIFTAVALLYSGGQQVGRREMPAILLWAGTPIVIGPFRITMGVIIVLIMAVIMAFILARARGVGTFTPWGTTPRLPGWSASGSIAFSERLHGCWADLRHHRMGADWEVGYR